MVAHTVKKKIMGFPEPQENPPNVPLGHFDEFQNIYNCFAELIIFSLSIS